jgi:hypothetical protein
MRRAARSQTQVALKVLWAAILGCIGNLLLRINSLSDVLGCGRQAGMNGGSVKDHWPRHDCQRGNAERQAAAGVASYGGGGDGGLRASRSPWCATTSVSPESGLNLHYPEISCEFQGDINITAECDGWRNAAQLPGVPSRKVLCRLT